MDSDKLDAMLISVRTSRGPTDREVRRLRRPLSRTAPCGPTTEYWYVEGGFDNTTHGVIAGGRRHTDDQFGAGRQYPLVHGPLGHPAHGSGSEHYVKGGKGYSGSFVKGKRNGKGRCGFPDGSVRQRTTHTRPHTPSKHMLFGHQRLWAPKKNKPRIDSLLNAAGVRGPVEGGSPLRSGHAAAAGRLELQRQLAGRRSPRPRAAGLR
jgi:hypothetical protein